jgi:hypothetical protein
MVLSVPPVVARGFPAGLNVAAQTPPKWPVRGCPNGWPVTTIRITHHVRIGSQNAGLDEWYSHNSQRTSRHISFITLTAIHFMTARPASPSSLLEPVWVEFAAQRVRHHPCLYPRNPNPLPLGHPTHHPAPQMSQLTVALSGGLLKSHRSFMDSWKAPTMLCMGRVAQSLLLLQAAFGLTAAIGMVVLMGFNPIYAVAPVLYAAMLIVLGALAARNRRWSLYVVVVVEALALAGWQLQQTIALLPQLDATLNLTGVLTTFVLPLVILLICVRILIRSS